jgi:hypothetical protein
MLKLRENDLYRFLLLESGFDFTETILICYGIRVSCGANTPKVPGVFLRAVRAGRLFFKIRQMTPSRTDGRRIGDALESRWSIANMDGAIDADFFRRLRTGQHGYRR